MARDNRCDATIDVLIVSCPTGNTDPHRRAALPFRASAPARTVILNSANHASRGVVIAERDEHLVQHHVVEHRESGAAESFGETSGLPAVALDHFGEAVTAE